MQIRYCHSELKTLPKPGKHGPPRDMNVPTDVGREHAHRRILAGCGAQLKPRSPTEDHQPSPVSRQVPRDDGRLLARVLKKPIDWY